MARRPYQDTAVDAYKSQGDLDRLMTRYGADVTRWSNYPGLIRFEFQLGGLGYRIDVPVPDGETEKQTEQLRREKARVMFYYIKAKMTAAESGVADLAREFMPYMITGTGRVLAEEIADAMATGARVLPLGADYPLLPEGRGRPVDSVEG
jgi:hypothetical protein